MIVGWGQQIPAAQRAYDSGLRLEAQGRHKEAAENFARAVDINPEFGDAYYQLGFKQSSRGGDTSRNPGIHILAAARSNPGKGHACRR